MPEEDSGEGSSGFGGTGNGSTPTTGATAPSPGEGSGGADTGGPATSGVGFIENPDGGGVSFECDIFAQDCPEGEKCMPWANDGAGAWNATRCSPIEANPGQPGDECTVEGTGTSGIDSCDIGSQCWDADPETNIGTCVAMCTGDEANPVCEDPDTTCTIANEGAIVLCLPVCDPIIQDCDEGQACYPINDTFACAPDASGEMGVYSDPCEFLNVCDPGLFCVVPEAVPGCNAAGCCTESCDLDDPAGDSQCEGQPQGQQCVSWFPEGEVPPGFESVGFCAIPAN